MKVLVNGQPLEISLPVATAQVLFDAIGRHADWRQMVVARVTADGSPIDIPAGDEPFPPPTMTADVFEFTVESPVNLLGRSLTDGDALLARMSERCASVSGDFREGRIKEASEGLAQLLENVGLFMDYVAEILRFVGVTFDGFAGAPAAHELLNRTLAVSKDMLASQENEDHVTLADLLEFELNSLVNDWRGYLAGPDFAIED